MQSGRSTMKRILALVMILAVVMTVGVTMAHGHAGGGSSDTCQFCIASHAFSSSALPAVVQVPAAVASEFVLLVAPDQQPGCHTAAASSRAPPTFLS